MFAQCLQCSWEYINDHSYEVFDQASFHKEATNHNVKVS
jgi:hypothetical protein